MRAFRMTVGAHDITLGDFSEDKFGAPRCEPAEIETLGSANVIELHHVVGVFDSAIGARSVLRLALESGLTFLEELPRPLTGIHCALDQARTGSSRLEGGCAYPLRYEGMTEQHARIELALQRWQRRVLPTNSYC